MGDEVALDRVVYVNEIGKRYRPEEDECP